MPRVNKVISYILLVLLRISILYVYIGNFGHVLDRYTYSLQSLVCQKCRSGNLFYCIILRVLAFLGSALKIKIIYLLQCFPNWSASPLDKLLQERCAAFNKKNHLLVQTKQVEAVSNRQFGYIPQNFSATKWLRESCSLWNKTLRNRATNNAYLVKFAYIHYNTIITPCLVNMFLSIRTIFIQNIVHCFVVY